MLRGANSNDATTAPRRWLTALIELCFPTSGPVKALPDTPARQGSSAEVSASRRIPLRPLVGSAEVSVSRRIPPRRFPNSSGVTMFLITNGR
jgi:hypothetical protein